MSTGGPTAQLPVAEQVATAPPSRRWRGGSARDREDRRVGYLLISPTLVIVFAMSRLPWRFSAVV